MNIIVLCKRTFDTEEKVVLKDGRISGEHAECIINPYDEYAIEEAIKLKEEYGGQVTLLSVGPEEVEKQLRTALAMGADQAVLIRDDEGISDEYRLSHMLYSQIKEMQFDLILAGNVSIDNGGGQVASRIAELLDIPQVTAAVNIQMNDQKVIVERDVEGDIETIETTLPALFTAQQGLNEPRYPSLPGIMKARKKPLEHVAAADMVGYPFAAKTETLGVFTPPKKTQGMMLDGETVEQVNKLIYHLHQDEKML